MDNRLQNRIAIVTGASSGVGQAIARRFALSGARVVCSDLQPTARGRSATAGPQDGQPSGSSPEATHELIQREHGTDRAIFVECDVTQEDQVAALVSRAAEWGRGRLDIMVNNAGITLEPTEVGGGQRIHEMDVQLFDRTVAVNLRGVWLGCKHAIAQMLAQEPLPGEVGSNYRGERTRGWVVNLASIFGVVGAPCTPNYTAAKHGVVGLTRQVALDYARDRIHCNCLCPGFVRTPMIEGLLASVEREQEIAGLHPWGKIGEPEDVARAALFLASEDAAWITGHSLAVDGGFLAR